MYETSACGSGQISISGGGGGCLSGHQKRIRERALGGGHHCFFLVLNTEK